MAYRVVEEEKPKKRFRVVDEPQPGQSGSIADPLAQGATLGFADEIAGALGAIPAAIQTGNSVPEAYRGIRDAARQQRSDFAERNPGTALGAELAGGLLTGGVGTKYVAGAKGADLIRKSTMLGGLLGGTSGLGYSNEDTVTGLLADAGQGAAIGGALGYAFPAAGQALSKAKANMVAGRSSDPYKKAVSILENKGVPLTTGQKSGANWAKSAENTLSEVPYGGKPLQSMFESQRKDFQRKLFQMIGVDDADMLTAENLKKASDKLSDDYVRALEGKHIDLGADDFLDDIAGIESTHTRFLDDPTKAKVRRVVSEFLDEATKDPMKDGKWYQAQRSIFAKRAMKNSDLADLYDDLKHALDREFARAAGSVKGDVDKRFAQYAQLRDLYQRMAGGSEGAEGFIPVNQLARIASKSPGSQEWKEFTRAAATVLPDRMGNSGTAQRNALLGLLGMGAFEPTSMIAGPLVARQINNQLAKGRMVDVTRMMPGGGLLQNPALVAPAASAGLLVAD